MSETINKKRKCVTCVGKEGNINTNNGPGKVCERLTKQVTANNTPAVHLILVEEGETH